MAIASVWITVVFMLVTFDVTKAIDEHGRVIEPSNKFASGFSQVSLSAECCTLLTSNSKSVCRCCSNTPSGQDHRRLWT
jgi:hypothetical protein